MNERKFHHTAHWQGGINYCLESIKSEKASLNDLADRLRSMVTYPDYCSFIHRSISEQWTPARAREEFEAEIAQRTFRQTGDFDEDEELAYERSLNDIRVLP